MLQDLSQGHYATSNVTSNHSNAADYSVYSDFGSFTKVPNRPPPPKSSSSRKVKSDTSSNVGSTAGSNKVPRRPPHPPKLQHILKGDGKCHDLVKATPRDDDPVEVPDFSDYEDYGSTIPDYGITSNYSTLPSLPKEHEAEIHLDLKDIKVDNVDTGEAPRGDESMVIKTDYGEIKSKYVYLGFGLWENTEPVEPPPPPKKPSPPPPPPKAEPIWYNCTVSVEKHITSKELDDLEHGLDGYARMPERNIEVGYAGQGIPGCLGILEEPFEKEDMSEMFRRAFLEKMAVEPSDKPIYKCYVCREIVKGRVITAMTHKFHPECFVCTYCRKEFKDRTFKADPVENRPYCRICFEKLLGHFGTAHGVEI